MLTIEELKQQLEASEREFEAAKMQVGRCDGIIQLLKHQIKLVEDRKANKDKANEEEAKKPSKSAKAPKEG